MTASFVEHFRRIIKMQYVSTSSFHNPKLSQEKWLISYVCSAGLFKGCSMNEATDSFFRGAI